MVAVHRLGVDSGTFTCIEGSQHSVMPGGWEGGSLTALRDVIRQMCTIGRMAVIYTTLVIVRYLLL